MKIVKARQLLGKIIQPAGDLLNNRPVIKYQFGDKHGHALGRVLL